MEEQNQTQGEEMKNDTSSQSSSEKGGSVSDMQKDIEENKLWALIGYLGILCLIPLLAKKDSKFAQFHAKQGLVLAIGGFFAWVPFFGWILGLFLFVLWIMGIVNVLSGKMKPLPVVGELAEKINI